MGFTSKLAKKAIFRHSLLSFSRHHCSIITERHKNTVSFQTTSKAAITYLDLQKNTDFE
ncbi:hypothetical protein GARC_4544 [Paraglaciecola arctica BSs20135]|uniref:Uncharacterized protein n=1 Tax=Paraglaciecola arctica BSs20135 TaxID=493475 RepID=K6YC09_9ALTE|nr:hypothetical protein GARC_4544 [Paraglaciecola arctica BSs20135]